MKKGILTLLVLLLASCSSGNVSSSETITSSYIDTGMGPEIVRLSQLNEQYISRQYYLNHIGDIYSTWSKGYTGKGVKVAVIDVGFNPYHEDLRVLSKVDPLSASFTTTGDTTTTEVGIDKVVNMAESHGTFCAGIVGASFDENGVIGIAYNSQLLLLKTDAKPKSIAKAFKYAADNGAKVITISIGSYYNYDGDLVNDGSDLSTVFNEPVQYCIDKGTVVISAGGNGGKTSPNEYTWPGATPNVIGVGALEKNSSGEIWDGSSYNSSKEYQFIDVFAPGSGMFGCCHYDDKKYDGGWNGTSFASPIVAGIAALYFEKYPTASVAKFTEDLFNTCTPITDSKIATEDQLGYGAVNVSKLLNIQPLGSFQLKVRSNWDEVYAYIWDTRRQVEAAPWPGVKLTKGENNYFTYTVDPSLYDNLLFTKSSNGPQTVDLLVSSFKDNNTYDIRNLINESGLNIGQFTK